VLRGEFACDQSSSFGGGLADPEAAESDLLFFVDLPWFDPAGGPSSSSSSSSSSPGLIGLVSRERNT
ncbi:hypothetical protein Tco_0549922, partial [Tanacetum coccineum]